MTISSGSSLTSNQYRALFDILTHHETYSEIAGFKNPGTIYSYGPPFEDTVEASTSPLLQTLFAKFILTLPGLRDISTDFWKIQVAELVEDLSQAELSESYDKGVLGIRKTLATASSALIEYPARGSLGTFARAEEQTPRDKDYDITKPEDVLQAWQDALQAAVYDDYVDEIFSRVVQTDDLQQHSSLTRAVHEFLLVKCVSHPSG